MNEKELVEAAVSLLTDGACKHVVSPDDQQVAHYVLETLDLPVITQCPRLKSYKTALRDPDSHGFEYTEQIRVLDAF